MNTRVWIFFVWAAFIISCLSAAGIVYDLPVPFETKALIGAFDLLLVYSSISLAKTLRDNAEEIKKDNHCHG